MVDLGSKVAEIAGAPVVLARLAVGDHNNLEKRRK